MTGYSFFVNMYSHSQHPPGVAANGLVAVEDRMDSKPDNNQWLDHGDEATRPLEYNRGFEAAAELAADGLIVFDRDGRVGYASQALSDLLGFRRRDLQKKNTADLTPEPDRAAFLELLDLARKNSGQRQKRELSVTPAWGGTLDVEATALAPAEADGRVLVGFRDISLPKIMEKEQRQSNRFLRKIIMNSMEGIVVLDVSGNILHFNQGASKMLGWLEVEVLGRMHISEIFDHGTIELLEERLLADDTENGPPGILHPTEVVVISRFGERIPVNLTVSSIVERDREVARVGIFSDLRVRVAMEDELRQTRDYLNNVVENAFDIIITTDLDSRIVSFNRGGERILGYSAAEMVGRPIESLYPNPEERRSLLRRIEHFDGAVSNYETRLKHKNGSLVDISMTLSLLTDQTGQKIGTVGISKDISQRKRAENELRATRDYLNAIVENTPDMIITTDLEKRIVSFNRGAERILGFKRDDVLGRHIEDLYVEREERQALFRLLDDQSNSVNYETQLIHQDGHVVEIDLTLSHLPDKFGDIMGTVGISKDITEKKRVEAELAEKKALLEEAQLQILHNEKMASLGKLATSVAHEINNPLGGILLFCEMVLEEMDEGDTNRPDLLQIREQTLRCREIVKGLLEFGRMTGTHYTFIDINQTVERGVALFANQTIFQNIKLEWRLDPDLPQIMGDSSQLNQVFTNLIVNALDALDGKGTLSLTTYFDDEAEEVVAIVGDTGCGIDPDILPRLFEPFFTTKPVGEGVGLGLSTSYSIVKRHNGRIDVDSLPGEGARFAVHLPLQGPDQE